MRAVINASHRFASLITMKPFAESSEQNKQAILAVLKQEFTQAQSVLEIGSGTGQHAVFFAEQFPHLYWHASDVAENLPGISLWLQDYPGHNLLGPYPLDVTQANWPVTQIDAVFSANTAHIMHWPAVQAMFAGVSRILQEGGRFCLYGPFNYHGAFTSDSNARFDAWLKARDPASGVRDIDDLLDLAHATGLELLRDHAMPANNRTLVWEKPATR
jgi:cyclopropane fatty-acyl-phospholipid synthase-like methyltransferase